MATRGPKYVARRRSSCRVRGVVRFFRGTAGGTLFAGAMALAGCAEFHAPVAAPQALPTQPPATAAPAAEPTDPSAEPAEEDEGFGEHADGSGTGEGDEGDEGEFDGTLLDHPAAPSALVASAHSPLADLSGTEIARRVKEDQASLGSLSLGLPNRGRLVNGVQMPASDHYTLTSPSCAYGTSETVESLSSAIDKVFAKYPDSQKLIIGHISARTGGRLSPHKSHQAGRDVDISYFYEGTKNWYAVANAQNLDRARTWAFVKALLADPNIEMIFIDSSIQKLLKEHAIAIGEDKAWLDDVFQYGGKGRSPIIRHVKGHATHLHIRFVSPIAQASARIASAYLPRKEQPSSDDDTRDSRVAHNGRPAKNGGGKGGDRTEYIFHRARSGDTLDSLARHYGVSVKSIMDANGLATNKIKEKMTYRIPKGGVVESAPSHGQRTAQSDTAGPRSRKGTPAKKLPQK